MKHILLILSIFISTTFASPLINRTNTFTDATVMICQSKGAKVYHSHECRGLANCNYQVLKISKLKAIKMGRKACKNCYK